MNATIVAPQKKKYFVFSDESGSWHDPKDIYVRAWVAVPEAENEKLERALQAVVASLGCRELKWKTLAGNPKFFGIVDDFNCRIFLTVSSPADIKWDEKYRITRSFSDQVEALDFGELDADLVKILKKKMYDDIRNVLFLKFYGKVHIENAKLGIDRVLSAKENELIYRVDPPQMSKVGWEEILHNIAPEVQIEFPKSSSNLGIQFADIVAGCIRSFLISDEVVDQAAAFIAKTKHRFIAKSRDNPNPNLIFFKEINDGLKERVGKIWEV